MATMTIRNIDAALKSRLRMRAAMHGKSMAEEARDILRAVLSTDAPGSGDLGKSIRGRRAHLGGVGLQSIQREPTRDPVDFAPVLGRRD